MAAEILEQETQEQATEPTPMSTEELVQDLSPQPEIPQTESEPEPSIEDDLPEKYRGKSIKEIVTMHQEAEKLIGSQGSEVGELRKVVDDFIMGQTKTESPEPEIEEIDFFDDPQKAVSQAVSQHPDVKAARETSAQMQREASQARLDAAHPDVAQIVNDPAFISWVRDSRIRGELFNRANQNYDFDAADELFSTWKERKAVASQTVAVEQQERKQQIAAATTGPSGSASSTAGAKRVYRRADIIKLMKTDPDRYDALQPEIVLAYQEGRVK